MHVQTENGDEVAAVWVKLLLNCYLLTSMATSVGKKNQQVSYTVEFKIKVIFSLLRFWGWFDCTLW